MWIVYLFSCCLSSCQRLGMRTVWPRFICAVQYFKAMFTYKLFWFFFQYIAKRLINSHKPVIPIYYKHKITNGIKRSLPFFIGFLNSLLRLFAFGNVRDDIVRSNYLILEFEDGGSRVQMDYVPFLVNYLKLNLRLHIWVLEKFLKDS